MSPVIRLKRPVRVFVCDAKVLSFTLVRDRVAVGGRLRSLVDCGTVSGCHRFGCRVGANGAVVEDVWRSVGVTSVLIASIVIRSGCSKSDGCGTVDM